MEKWDVYDFERQKKGFTRSEDEKFLEGECRLVVHGILINDRREMLIQKRSRKKKIMPSYWDLTWAGSVQAGEDSYQGLIREAKEELGLEGISWKRPDFTINFPQGYDDFYIFRRNIDLDKLTIDLKEVEKVKWASLADILNLIDKGEFIAYSESFIRLIFDVARTGAIYSEKLL